MNTAHPVAPEEVMALLDGELSAAAAQAISAHLDQCAECTGVAAQFRDTSRSLSRWSVPTAPAKLEQPVKDLANKTRLGLKTGKPGVFVRANLWTRKQWTLGLGSTVAAVLILVATVTLYLGRRPMAAKARVVAQQNFVRKLPLNPSKVPAAEFGSGDTDRSLAIEGRVGGLDKLNGQPSTDQQSKAFSNEIVSPKVEAATSPGVAADSNGLFHGLGGHAQNSFSVDGQPALMIARTAPFPLW
jgi:hypothetical protein